MHITKKVSENRISEKEYRSLKQRLNYSGLKLFDTNRRKFFTEHVLGEKRDEKQTVSTIMGNLVHALLSDEFDDKFVIANATPPVGQMLLLVEELYTRTLKSMNEEGVQTERFEVLFEDAFNRVKYDFEGKEVNFKGKTLEKVVEMFSDSTAETYYKEMRANIGKIVVGLNTITQGEKLVEKLRTHPYTRDIVNVLSSDTVEVFNELPILFSIDGVEFRALLDRIKVDHVYKKITPYDWKTSWSIEDGGFERAYLKLCYYLQVALYHKALEYFAKEHGLEGYTIEPMTYIAIDTTGWLDPIVFQCTMQDVLRGWEGFREGNYEYNGARDIIMNIAHHLNTGVWTSNRETMLNDGKMYLKIKYS